ncbi:MAG: molecular chaperone TorD family protein [Thermodesulfovibrionia bacterium]|nr:molecular chaperone TorD family protein [Thermodesulfovibrionia bacterium]
MQLTEEFIQKETHRADCYRLLSACYCKPGKEFIEEGLVKNLITALEPICNNAVPFAKDMDNALSKYTNTEILVDYSALFIGPFGLLAPPYGSVYLEGKRTVMGDTTIDAVKYYRKAGVEMDPAQKDMPDHISVELEFMYYLINKGLEAYQNSDNEGFLNYHNMQEDFLRRHIGVWMPKFAKDLREGAKNPFYKNLADCTLTFIKSDMEYMMIKRGEKGMA